MPAKRKPRARLNTIERHPERMTIELASIAGVTLNRIAERFGVSRMSVWRHMQSLEPEYRASLAAEVPREEIVRRAAEESGNLLDHFKMVRNLAERQLIEAKACGDGRTVARLAMAALAANEHVGKLSGEIQRAMPGVSITNNVAVSIADQPDFRVLETGLIDLAQRFPETKGDILALIRRVRSTPPAIEGEVAHAA